MEKVIKMPEEPMMSIGESFSRILVIALLIAGVILGGLAIQRHLDKVYGYETYVTSEGGYYDWLGDFHHVYQTVEDYNTPYDPDDYHPIQRVWWNTDHNTGSAGVLVGCMLLGIVLYFIINAMTPHYQDVRRWENECQEIADRDTQELQRTWFELARLGGYFFTEQHSSSTVAPTVTGDGKIGITVVPTTTSHEEEGIRIRFFVNDREVMEVEMSNEPEDLKWDANGTENKVNFPEACRNLDGTIDVGYTTQLLTTREVAYA